MDDYEIIPRIYQGEQKGFSIGTSQRSDFLQLKNKAEADTNPQTYYPSQNFTKPKPQEWSISNLERDTLQYFNYYKKVVPGPNVYKTDECDKQVKNRSETYKFGLKLQQKQPETNQFPAPNNYFPINNSQKQLSYTLRDRYDEFNNFLRPNNPDTPSVTDYQTQSSSVVKLHSVKMGKQTKEKTWKQGTIYDNKNPGAGQYLSSEYQKTTPQWQFHKAQRFDRQVRSKSPKVGPGTYEIPITIPNPKNSKSISPPRKTTHKEEKDSKLPGPASYQYEKSMEKIMHQFPQQIIGKSNRSESPSFKTKTQFKNLSPQSYNLNFNDKPNPKKHRFGTSKRLVSRKNSANEDQIQSDSELQFDKSKDSKSNKKHNTPGPGQYDIKSKAVEGYKYKIQGRNNQIMVDRQKQFYPSPNFYNPNDKKIHESSPAYKIGTSQRQKLQNSENPQPNKYNVERSLNYQKNTQKYTFGKAKRFASPQNNDDDIPFMMFL